jgi:glycosyltransferase involved in cell wall biosynthesis
MADFVPQHLFEEMYRKREVDAVILPSFDIGDEDGEGIPVCLMDAMAYGVPVVSTDAGGIPELIGDGGGIMVEQRDAGQLADAIEMLIKDREMWCAVGEKGKRKVERDFNLRTVSESLLAIFNSHRVKKGSPWQAGDFA